MMRRVADGRTDGRAGRRRRRRKMADVLIDAGTRPASPRQRGGGFP